MGTRSRITKQGLFQQNQNRRTDLSGGGELQSINTERKNAEATHDSGLRGFGEVSSQRRGKWKGDSLRFGFHLFNVGVTEFLKLLKDLLD